MTASIESIPRKREERTPLPFDAELEQSILGILLADNRRFDHVSDFLRAEHFYIPAHARLFDMIGRELLAGRLADPLTLRNWELADPDLAMQPGYLASLYAGALPVPHFADYARSLVDIALKRGIIQATDDIRAHAVAPGCEGAQLLELAEKEIFDIAESKQTAISTRALPSILTNVINEAEAAYRSDGELIGLTTGLLDIDKRLGGFHPSDLVILAGATSMGKTALAAGMAWKAAYKAPVLYFSAEMSAEQIAHRIACSEAGLESDRVRRGEVTPEEFRRFVMAARTLSSLPLFINDRPAPSLMQMHSDARRLKRQRGLGLIVVDYLQLMSSVGKRPDNRVQEVGSFSRGLKGLAKEMEVPVLALAQLSRSIDHREDKRPVLADLRESGSIEHDADVVMFIFREEYYLDRDKPTQRKDESEERFTERQIAWQERRTRAANLAEVTISKNRHGPLGNVSLRFDGPTTTFSDLAAHYDPARAM